MRDDACPVQFQFQFCFGPWGQQRVQYGKGDACVRVGEVLARSFICLQHQFHGHVLACVLRPASYLCFFLHPDRRQKSWTSRVQPIPGPPPDPPQSPRSSLLLPPAAASAIFLIHLSTAGARPIPAAAARSIIHGPGAPGLAPRVVR